MAVPVRSVLRAVEAALRLLRAADSVARARHRLGEPLDEGRRIGARLRLCRGPAARSNLQARARRGDRALRDVPPNLSASLGPKSKTCASPKRRIARAARDLQAHRV